MGLSKLDNLYRHDLACRVGQASTMMRMGRMIQDHLTV